MQFAAIDVETANPDLSSICQVGVAVFRNRRHVDSWSTLVDPQDDFDELNVAIHGINKEKVRGAPGWPIVADTLRKLLTDSVVVCHTPFDRAATRLACEKHRLDHFTWKWLDTARVVRRAWPDKFAAKGYGLHNVAKFLEIDFRHHDALEDARAVGEVLCRASAHAGMTLADWLLRVEQSINPEYDQPMTRDGNREGPLFGNVAVFTGSLAIPRREAADLAARAGCDVAASVTKRTTLLVVGDQDVAKLAGKSESSKHLKAAEMISQGNPIRVLRESDFQNIVMTHSKAPPQ